MNNKRQGPKMMEMKAPVFSLSLFLSLALSAFHPAEIRTKFVRERKRKKLALCERLESIFSRASCMHVRFLNVKKLKTS